MQAGELLLENGAEIFRVEETMDRICRHYGVESASQFILMNYILATAGEGHGHVFAKVRHIPVNGSHLDKVAAVNHFQRDRGRKIYGFRSLSGIGDDSPDAGQEKSVLILASGVASGAFCCPFGGNLMDCLAAAIAGFLIYVYILYISGPHLSKIVVCGRRRFCDTGLQSFVYGRDWRSSELYDHWFYDAFGSGSCFYHCDPRCSRWGLYFGYCADD